ncbi:15018_t:CDS:2 [Gigaspora margarita]|uniref:Dynein heavy chain, cytoplasmic n=1 Tax=Gigaspora margarita TaxID=4874 RepID=A0ABN7ULB6_GIGMA|nr:15018_t:CDS:2 [Gigaspora margarita]
MLKVVPSLKSYAEIFTASMVEFYLMSKKRVTPDIQAHYIYSPRELIRWMRSIFEVINPMKFLNLEGLIRIWAHEALRFISRPSCHSRRKEMGRRKIDYIAIKHFQTLTNLKLWFVQFYSLEISGINRLHLDEIHTMNNPPEAVKMAIRVTSVLIVLGCTGYAWSERQYFVRSNDFINGIVQYDTKASKACGPLVNWVIAQVSYSDILDKLATDDQRSNDENIDSKMDEPFQILPDDDLCTKNLLCLRDSIDIRSSLKASSFLMNEFNKDKNFIITRFLGNSFVKLLEDALRFGYPLLVQDAEHFDPILNSVHNKEVSRYVDRILIRFRGQDIDFSLSFKPSVNFSPDICKTPFRNSSSCEYRCVKRSLSTGSNV